MSKVKSKKHLKLENWKFDKTIKIHESIHPIETTLDNPRAYDDRKEKPPTINWVNKIRQIYYVNKKPKSKVVVGVHAESDPHSCNYFLQICIGNHCLIHLTEIYNWDNTHDVHLPKALVGLLLDSKTVVASAKLNDLEKILEKAFHLRLPRTLDLNAEAAVSLGLARDRFHRHGLMKLAKMVLRDEGDLDWDEVWRNMSDGDERSTVRWWQNEEEEELTVVKLRCGTFLAFLAYKMGVKLISC